MKPYTEKIISRQISERVFLEKDKNLFLWHRDYEDRKIIVLESGNNWFIQLDNQLPEVLLPGKIVTIKALVFHRVIAGNDSLKIKIVKDFKIN